MTPGLLLKLVVRPVVAYLDWPQPAEREALLVAIAMQESKLRYRRQVPRGPAQSWWQIEPPTAVDCLRRCPPVRELWRELGLGLWLGDGPKDQGRIEGLAESELGACAVAAGILRLHPGALPWIDEPEKAWRYYLAAWRPGKPRIEGWAAAHEDGVRAMA